MEVERNRSETELTASVQAPYSNLYWLISEALLIFVTAITIYILVCLAKYGLKTGCKPGSEVRGKKGKILFQTCLVSVAMAVGRLLSDQAVALLGWQTDIGCRVTVTISVVFYSLSLYPVYIFLWLRQSIFYASPVLANVLNPVVTVFSWTVLVCMVAGGAVITIFFNLHEITGWTYAATESGCRDISDDNGFELVPTILVCFIITIQIGLLFLFVYPLVSKKTQRYREAGKGNRSSQLNSVGSDVNGENSSNLFSNEHDEISNHRMSGVNFANEMADDTSSLRDTKYSDEINYKQADNHQLGVLYRKQTNEVSKSKKKSLHKNKGYSFANQVKRGINWSVTSAGSYRNSKKRRGSKTQQGRRIIKFIRKAFFLALVCVISDVIFTIIQLTVVVPELVYLVLYDINLLINIICIILSFRNWPMMILPSCFRGMPADLKSKSQKSSTVAPVERDVKIPISLHHDKPNLSPKHVIKRNMAICSSVKISPQKYSYRGNLHEK